jgi:hypothetical protein
MEVFLMSEKIVDPGNRSRDPELDGSDLDVGVSEVGGIND